MKCSISDCPGQYEDRKVVHTVRHNGHVVVIDGVPAEVCSICGDVLLKPDTARRIEAILRAKPASQTERLPCMSMFRRAGEPMNGVGI